MSKMTIKDENDGGTAKYNHLKLVEFLEYIARIAMMKFKHGKESLAEKIEMTLDIILPLYGLKRA